MTTTELYRIIEQKERHINSLEEQNKSLIVDKMDLQEQLALFGVKPRFSDDEEQEDEEEHEPDGYECMSCGNIQGKSNGFGCDNCQSPLKDWFS